VKTRMIQSPKEAGALLQDGKLVAFPTDTVFGLGAKATCSDAVHRIFVAKGRPNDNPLIVHLHDAEHWRDAAAEMTDIGNALLRTFSPGPITVVLPKSRNLPANVTAGLPTVGIRVPACEAAREVIESSGVPIAAPSANLSGKPSATNWQSVYEDLDGRIDAILCVNSSLHGVESTVVDCTGSNPIVLRPGGITLEQIQALFPNAYAANRQNPHEKKTVISPGTLHPHYQPRASVIILETTNSPTDQLKNLRTEPSQCAICGLRIRQPSSTAGQWRLWKEFNSVEHYAEGFYEFLRAADRAGADFILIELAPDAGLGTALRDRQLRAAGPRR
jgi:L-threonylcarbamoyladenylate synthase